MLQRHASCNCGALTVVCEGEPQRVSVCHCLACRRRTGSAFSYNATFRREQVTAEGERSTFSRLSDAGRLSVYSFCPRCGSTVFYEIEARPGMVTIPAGAFADPEFPEPTVSAFPGRQSAWLAIRPRCHLDEEDA